MKKIILVALILLMAHCAYAGSLPIEIPDNIIGVVCENYCDHYPECDPNFTLQEKAGFLKKNLVNHIVNIVNIEIRKKERENERNKKPDAQ